MSNEHVYNETIDLFVALNILDGTVVPQLHRRHRYQEFLVFLREIDEKVPKELDVRMVLDNLSTHTTLEAERWFARRLRFKLYFTPKGVSWLSMVELWFGQLTEKQIRRNSFPHTRALIRAIKELVAEHQGNPCPFVWTVNADEILRKVAKLRRPQATGEYDGLDHRFIVSVTNPPLELTPDRSPPRLKCGPQTRVWQSKHRIRWKGRTSRGIQEEQSQREQRSAPSQREGRCLEQCSYCDFPVEC